MSGGPIRVRYFAAARELACDADLYELGPCSSAALREAIAARHPGLAPHLGRMRFAVNGVLEEPNTIDAESEVDVLPPVAGGSGVAADKMLIAVRDTPLSIDEAFAVVKRAEAGGVVIFVGVVRDHSGGKSVSRLDYEAHPSLAEQELRAVASELIAEHPDARIATTHRTGSLEIGDLAVVVAASAPHRAEAFDVARAMIDRLKERAPIWKKEWDGEGEPTWVNLTP